MRYTPSPFLVTDFKGLAEYVQRELSRIAATLLIPEMRQINYGKEVINTASTSATSINWKAGQKQKLELDASSTLTFVAPEGVCNLMLRIEYGGAYTPTFPSTVKWQGGTTPTWTSTASAVDVIAMYFDGTNYHATASLDSK